MLGKILVVIVFFVILYNLFCGLKYLFQSDKNSEALLQKLKYRIILSVSLFAMIIVGFMTGFIPLHDF